MQIYLTKRGGGYNGIRKIFLIKKGVFQIIKQKEKRKMTLKVKLTSTIAAFVLVLGLLIMGVFASPTATINLGGSISFKATDVHATVQGKITGSKEAEAVEGETKEINLNTLNFKAGATEEEKPKRLVREIVKKKLKVDNMSQAFNPDYYLYNIEKCKKGGENYIYWQTMFNYAMRVKDFYVCMVKAQNFALKREQILPDYMLDSSSYTAKEAATILFHTEQSMLEKFKKEMVNLK